MQIVSSGDSLHEMSKPILLEKKQNKKKTTKNKTSINLSSAEFAKRLVKVNFVVPFLTTSFQYDI